MQGWPLFRTARLWYLRLRLSLTAGKAQGLCPRPAYANLAARICEQILAEQFNIFKVKLLFFAECVFLCLPTRVKDF